MTKPDGFYADIATEREAHQCLGKANTITFTSGSKCQHRNGWYVTVKFFWFFKKRIFVCADCGENLPHDWKKP